MVMGLFGRTEAYPYTPITTSPTRGPSPKTQFVRIVSLILILTLIVCTTITPLYLTHTRHVSTGNWPSWVDTANPAEYLKTTRQPIPVPGADESLLMLKTGAQVLWQRLPVQMVRLQEIYAPNTAFYSDLEETIQGHTMINILANSSDKLLQNPQFKPYHEQLKLHKEGVSLSDANIGGGWDLDKYKWVPMFYHAYKNNPNMKWYIFYEADSFLFWNSLNRWLLKNYDHNKPWYMGSVNILGSTLFGHGGSGVVVSQAAMRMTFSDPFDPADYDDMAIATCCGDGLLADVMLKKGVKIWEEQNGRFQGEQTYAIRHEPSNWCEPIFTLHHLKPHEVSMLHEWEKTLDPSKTIVYRDLYEQFVHKELAETKTDWDNMSEDVKIDHATLIKEFAEDERVLRDGKGQPNLESACKLKCEAWKECFQWQVNDKQCVNNSKVRLGQKKSGVVSGWLMDRVNTLREKQCSS
ncbi:hypothetical protein H072_9737 [Dactylellina haptotyla CBS 200.50]|uniref:Glycosyltransferase family 31 protein n=1 Tax=Dactylellina haptotyla (strain CBS 200.50) TaxID=1284197 RepID=S8A6E7_DACHA|nr:hypothetical protein H072_9737 [Dactylellina haptotyla CBS 200.50]